MATLGDDCNNWPRTVMTGGCVLMAFSPDGATGNNDDDDDKVTRTHSAGTQFSHPTPFERLSDIYMRGRLGLNQAESWS